MLIPVIDLDFVVIKFRKPTDEYEQEWLKDKVDMMTNMFYQSHMRLQDYLKDERLSPYEEDMYCAEDILTAMEDDAFKDIETSNFFWAYVYVINIGRIKK